MRLRRTRWSWLAWAAIAAIALAGAFAAACGDDDDDGENGEDTPAATSPTAAAEPTEAADETPAGDETPAADETETAGDGATIETSEDAELGTILVDARGFTLYTFGNDVVGSGSSACVDGCAQAWPPLSPEGEPTAGDGVTGEIGTIERNDGTTQVTYNGAPLYYYQADNAPGDTNGHNVGNIWFVATPE